MKDITDDKLYENATSAQAFERLCQIIEKLRSPQGCPWDREQTPVSMRQPLIEEVYEAVDAINNNDAAHVCEELGDVFLNATLTANIFQEQNDFTIAQCLNEVCSKIVRRHPHVWPPAQNEQGAQKIENSDQVVNQWEAIKQNVEGRKKKCELDEVSYGIPPLLRAYKIQKKAAKRGFDWVDVDKVWTKVYEELDELKQACNDNTNIEEELGDVLFTVVNLARKLKIDPEIALAKTNQKFRNRYAFVQEKMEENNIPMVLENIEQMDKFWDAAKEKE